MDKVKAGMERAGEEAGEMASIGKIKLEVRGLHGKMQEALQAIGARAYDLHESGTTFPADVDALCRDADKIAAEIKSKEAEIEKIQTEGKLARKSSPKGA